MLMRFVSLQCSCIRQVDLMSSNRYEVHEIHSEYDTISYLASPRTYQHGQLPEATAVGTTIGKGLV